jgi:hypothetical protein
VEKPADREAVVGETPVIKTNSVFRINVSDKTFPIPSIRSLLACHAHGGGGGGTRGASSYHFLNLSI